MKEIQKYCAVCKKETRHTIAFIGSPMGFSCAEHGSTKHCHQCRKELPPVIQKINKALNAHSYCGDCTLKGGRDAGTTS